MTWMELVSLVAQVCGALACYACLVWLGNEYSRKTKWQPPDAGSTTNWALRRNLSFASGCIAVAAGATCAALWLDPWPVRLLAIGQATLMAAAGSSDLRRFHLPLPFTMAGIGTAMVVALATGVPALILLFALVWSMAVILLHTLVSKGSMQLGDHIATVWIALASPFNGLLAVAAGDFANVALARVRGLRGRKVAAAGAWLICATVLTGVPPYFAWFATPSLATMLTPLPDASVPTTSVPTTLEPAATDSSFAGLQQVPPAAPLITLAEWASDNAASVGLATRRADRIVAAQNAGRTVAYYAVIAAQIAPGSDVAVTLRDLSDALTRYDVEEVRSAGLRLAEERQQLEPIATAQQVLASTQLTSTLH